MTRSKGDCLVWCLQCQRVSLESQWKPTGYTCWDWWKCPYEDCPGGLWTDGWDYEVLRREHADWPENPEPGVVYALYS